MGMKGVGVAARFGSFVTQNICLDLLIFSTTAIVGKLQAVLMKNKKNNKTANFLIITISPE